MFTHDRRIDRRILLEANSLRESGWTVYIVAMPLDTENTNDEPWIHRLSIRQGKARKENRLLWIYKLARKYLPMNGVVMKAMKRFTWRYLVDQEKFYLNLYADLKLDPHASIVVAHDLPMLPVAYRAASSLEAKLVYDSHELFTEQEFSKREKNKWTEIEKKYIASCDAVITVNDSFARELRKKYKIPRVHVILNAERTRTLPNNSKIFHSIFKLPGQARVLLLQGGLSAGRNLEALVLAMSLVKKEMIRLVIMGDGVIKKRLVSLADKYNLNGRVYFHPAVPQEELLNYTSAADAGVIPYQPICLNNYYCTPNKLFEYISAGLPILASDLPEIRGFIQRHNLGLVGDMSSSESIAHLIESFFSNEDWLCEWKQHVLVAKKHINWEVEEKKLINIYESLL